MKITTKVEYVIKFISASSWNFPKFFYNLIIYNFKKLIITTLQYLS